jgi:hypothetical protein
MNARPSNLTAADPILAIGRRLGDAQRRESLQNEANHDAGKAKKLSRQTYGEHRVAHTIDEIDALRMALSLAQATTLDGALIQVAEATSVADMIRDMFPEDAETYRVKATFRTLDRLLYSARHALERLSNNKLEELVSDVFSSPHLSPFVTVDEALAMIGLDEGK